MYSHTEVDENDMDTNANNLQIKFQFPLHLTTVTTVALL